MDINPTVGLIVALLSLVAFVLRIFSRRQTPAPAPPPDLPPATPLPPRLGVRPIEPFEQLAERVESAFTEDLHRRLKERVMTKQNLLFSNDTFEWTLLELKRYFLLNLLLRGVPMFSDQVDELWHEMLLFTRDYQAFCEKIAGTFIHHNPYSQRTPMPEERAWFDWVYTQVFLVSSFSVRAWGGFFRNPLSEARIRQLATLSELELVKTYFNAPLYDRDPVVRQAMRHLIDQAKVQSVEALRVQGVREASPPLTIATRNGLTDYSVLAPVFVASSLHEAEALSEWLASDLPNGDGNNKTRRSESDGSFCGAFGGCDGGSGDKQGDTGGDSSCGSSDSGCGSGCGGGCGGGCGS